MKHEILSWNTFTLVSNIHCVCFSSIKKLCFQRKISCKKFKNAKTYLNEIMFENQKACNFVKKRPQYRCFPVKFAKFLRTPPVAAYEFCSGGCVRIVSVSKYIIISNQCIKVNVWWIAWCCIHSKIMPELDS